MSMAKVAELAGVSHSTVSRYLRGTLQLSPDTEARVTSALEKVGYEPKQAGNSAQSTVVLVIPDLSNPFFAALADGISVTGASLGINVMVCVSGGSPSGEARLVQACLDWRGVAGLIFVGMSGRSGLLSKAAKRFPVVMADERIKISGKIKIPFVGADNFSGGYQATSYLSSYGHRVIGHIGGPTELESARHRLKGYKEALTDHGLLVRDSHIFSGPYSERFGANVLTYLTRLDPAPTALFVGSDIVAVGILSAAELHGLRIPEDLSLVGFDGISLGNWLRPKLSTIRQPVNDIVKAAFAQLEAMRNGDDPQDVLLPMEMQGRESVRLLVDGAS